MIWQLLSQPHSSLPDSAAGCEQHHRGCECPPSPCAIARRPLTPFPLVVSYSCVLSSGEIRPTARLDTPNRRAASREQTRRSSHPPPASIPTRVRRLPPGSPPLTPDRNADGRSDRTTCRPKVPSGAMSQSRRAHPEAVAEAARAEEAEENLELGVRLSWRSSSYSSADSNTNTNTNGNANPRPQSVTQAQRPAESIATGPAPSRCARSASTRSPQSCCFSRRRSSE